MDLQRQKCFLVAAFRLFHLMLCFPNCSGNLVILPLKLDAYFIFSTLFKAKILPLDST